MSSTKAGIMELTQTGVYQAAQRTGTSYLGTMDTVAKLGLGTGNVFKNSGETIAFVEQLNKQFKIAGTSQQGMTSATSQLEEVFGSGTMGGNQFDALNSAAPTVMQSVANYMNLPLILGIAYVLELYLIVTKISVIVQQLLRRVKLSYEQELGFK